MEGPHRRIRTNGAMGGGGHIRGSDPRGLASNLNISANSIYIRNCFKVQICGDRIHVLVKEAVDKNSCQYPFKSIPTWDELNTGAVRYPISTIFLPNMFMSMSMSLSVSLAKLAKTCEFIFCEQSLLVAIFEINNHC